MYVDSMYVHVECMVLFTPQSVFPQVFLYGGELHIIPIPSTPAEVTVYPAGVPTLQTALGLVWSHRETRASEGVQKAIQARIQG